MESTNGNGSLLGAGQLVTCCLDELNPHPSYVRHHLAVPASQLSALAERGDRAFLEPLWNACRMRSAMKNAALHIYDDDLVSAIQLPFKLLGSNSGQPKLSQKTVPGDQPANNQDDHNQEDGRRQELSHFSGVRYRFLQLRAERIAEPGI